MPLSKSITSKSPTFWKSVLLLALPVALQMLLQSLLGMADVVMVGDLGPEALAAVGLAAKLHFLLLVMMSGIAAGGSVLIAQYSGSKNSEGCRNTLSVTLAVGVAVIMPLVAAFAIAPQVWVNWINPDPIVVAIAAEYIQITALVLLLTQIAVIYEASLRALGNTTVPLIGGAVSVLVNIALNYALIFGHWGFPAMGVAGAAWATLIARAAHMILVVGWVYATRHSFALGLGDICARVDWPKVRRYIVFALPLVANYTLWGVGNATYHVLTGFAGTEALAIMGVIVPIESLFFALFIGLANASAVLVGRALGGDNHDEAWRLYRFFDQLTIGLVVSGCLVLWLIRPWVIAIFDQLDPAAEALLADVLAVFSLLIWVKVLNMMRIMGVLRAGGDNKFCLVVDISAMWLVGIPLYAAGVFFTAVPFAAIFALMYLEEALKFIPVVMRIRKRYWIKNLVKADAK